MVIHEEWSALSLWLASVAVIDLKLRRVLAILYPLAGVIDSVPQNLVRRLAAPGVGPDCAAVFSKHTYLGGFDTGGNVESGDDADPRLCSASERREIDQVSRHADRLLLRVDAESDRRG